MSLPSYLIPAVLGLAIPYATAWVSAHNLPSWIETVLNFLLSSVAAVFPTVAFNGDWKSYLIALGVAWVATMRSHYTQLPTALYEKATGGKHESPDPTPPLT